MKTFKKWIKLFVLFLITGMLVFNCTVTIAVAENTAELTEDAAEQRTENSTIDREEFLTIDENSMLEKTDSPDNLSMDENKPEEEEQPEALPFVQQILMSGLSIFIKAYPGVFPDGSKLSVTVLDDKQIKETVEKTANLAADTNTVIRHRLYSFSGPNMNGHASVQIYGIDLSSQYPESDISVYIFYWEENTHEVYPASFSVGENQNCLQFSLPVMSIYDIVTVTRTQDSEPIAFANATLNQTNTDAVMQEPTPLPDEEGLFVEISVSGEKNEEQLIWEDDADESSAKEEENKISDAPMLSALRAVSANDSNRLSGITYDGQTVHGRFIPADADSDFTEIRIRVTFYIEGNYYMGTESEVEADGQFSLEGVGPIVYITCIAIKTEIDGKTQKLCSEELFIDSSALPEPTATPLPTNYFKTEKRSDGTVEIKGYSGSERKVIVPSQIDGKKVVSIAPFAFAENTTITEITLPETVTELGDHAFFRCDKLNSVRILGNILSIKDGTFGYCYSLEDVLIPDSVKLIEDGVFWECKKIRTINLPEQLSIIGISAFDQCAGLIEITLPSFVAQIKDYAFSNCKNLKKITILSNKTEISDTAFYGCNENLCLVAATGSDAEKYASAHMISYIPIGYETDDSLPPVEPKSYDVLVINYDPVFEIAGNKKWHELLSQWSDPHVLAQEFAADMNEVSHGIVSYKIKQWIEIDEMPTGMDGFVYDKDTYYQTLQKAIAETKGSYWTYAGWENKGFNFDYEKCLEKYGVVDMVKNGEIDEVWIFTGPLHGNDLYETRMCGRNAFWCNSPGLEIDCRRFVVYGFNYERTAAEMIHDAGHRMESILSAVFGWCDYSKDYEDYTDWEKFSAYEQVSPNHAAVGLIHFAPNSTSDYDWGNTSKVESSCDDWLNYPNLVGKKRIVDSSEWNQDQRLFIKWWFSHIPHAPGRNPDNNKYNNWWKYFTLDF